MFNQTTLETRFRNLQDDCITICEKVDVELKKLINLQGSAEEKRQTLSDILSSVNSIFSSLYENSLDEMIAIVSEALSITDLERGKIEEITREMRILYSSCGENIVTPDSSEVQQANQQWKVLLTILNEKISVASCDEKRKNVAKATIEAVTVVRIAAQRFYALGIMTPQYCQILCPEYLVKREASISATEGISTQEIFEGMMRASVTDEKMAWAGRVENNPFWGVDNINRVFPTLRGQLASPWSYQTDRSVSLMGATRAAICEDVVVNSNPSSGVK